MSTQPIDGRADYVIVGAGSAGAVLANRLSEDPDKTVLLIEAGGRADSFLVQLPVGFAKMLVNPKFDWCYEHEDDPSMNGRAWVWSAGKMLGGSSSINGQVYIRGTRRDFDEWRDLGATGWSFDEVFPYFLRSETWQGPPSQAHGSHGPLSVAEIIDPHPLCRTFLDACREVGLPTLREYNDGASFGAFLTQTNQDNGWRCSTERGYLRPIRKRKNLTVITKAEVERVIVRNGRATGVVVRRSDTEQYFAADREVILSAGAMASPAILMRSGIGPATYLREQGIEVVVDSPGVGQNLQEHTGVGISKFVNIPTLNSQTGPLDMVRHMAKFFWNRTGPMSAPAVQAMGLAKTREGLVEPDVQLHFMPLAFAATPDDHEAKLGAMPKEPAISLNASLCKPRQRGRVVLGKGGQPRVIHRMVEHPEDIATMIGGLKLCQRILESGPMKSIVIGDRWPHRIPDSDDGWLDFMRANMGLTWHAAGTCRMGSDPEAVVDPQLRLNGVRGLRVVDASVMPTTTSSNTNAPTIMIGEKAADLIRHSS